MDSGHVSGDAVARDASAEPGLGWRHEAVILARAEGRVGERTDAAVPGGATGI